MTSLPNNYIYIDGTCVDDIYDQIFITSKERIITEKTSDISSLGISGSVGVRGIATIDGNVGGNGAYERTIQNVYTATATAKINKLIDRLIGRGTESFDRIIKEHRPIYGSLCCAGCGWFKLERIYVDGTPTSDWSGLNLVDVKMDSSTVLQLEHCTHLNTHADPSVYGYGYYQQSSSIELLMSADKIRTRLRHLTSIFREDAIFNMMIIGILSYCGGERYSVKPIAVCT